MVSAVAAAIGYLWWLSAPAALVSAIVAWTALSLILPPWWSPFSRTFYSSQGSVAVTVGREDDGHVRLANLRRVGGQGGAGLRFVDALARQRQWLQLSGTAWPGPLGHYRTYAADNRYGFDVQPATRDQSLLRLRTFTITR